MCAKSWCVRELLHLECLVSALLVHGFADSYTIYIYIYAVSFGFLAVGMRSFSTFGAQTQTPFARKGPAQLKLRPVCYQHGQQSRRM